MVSSLAVLHLVAIGLLFVYNFFITLFVCCWFCSVLGGDPLPAVIAIVLESMTRILTGLLTLLGLGFYYLILRNVRNS